MYPYQPIDCGFYDILEAEAVRGRPTEIVYLNEAGQHILVEARILDLFTRGSEEFAVLSGFSADAPLRLDRLVRVAGVDRPGFCAPAP
jgi:Rho-binding antiterminator